MFTVLYGANCNRIAKNYQFTTPPIAASQNDCPPSKQLQSPEYSTSLCNPCHRPRAITVKLPHHYTSPCHCPCTITLFPPPLPINIPTTSFVFFFFTFTLRFGHASSFFLFFYIQSAFMGHASSLFFTFTLRSGSIFATTTGSPSLCVCRSRPYSGAMRTSLYIYIDSRRRFSRRVNCERSPRPIYSRRETVLASSFFLSYISQSSTF